MAPHLIELARTLRQTSPAPKGCPYYALDSGVQYDLPVFDVLGQAGIFRKYEYALEIDCGLGGRARWLASRLGCRVLGLSPSLALAREARALNEWAHCESQVDFQVGSVAAIPLRERQFTHVWWLTTEIGALSFQAVSEAWRVLRRGAHFALQCRLDAPAESATVLERLGECGFFEIETKLVELPARPQSARVATYRLQQLLADEPLLWQQWRDQLAPTGRYTLQAFARRPA